MKFKKLFLLLLAASVINACGFHLRGAVELSDELSPVYLQQNGVFALAREIKSLLASNKISLAENEKQSKTQLSLIDETKNRRILSVDSSGRAREYLLSYKVRFSITINKAEKVEDAVSLTRSLLFDPDAVLAISNETEVLYKDMRRDAARRILLKLQATAASKSVDKNNAS